MLGIGLNDIKEWTCHWGHGGQAFRKEVLFALYQSAVSQEEKQFKLTLKKGILPYCPSVTLTDCLLRPSLIDADVIMALWHSGVCVCVRVYSVGTARLIFVAQRAVLHFILRICSRTSRCDLWKCRVMCFVKEKKMRRTRTTPEVWT